MKHKKGVTYVGEKICMLGKLPTGMSSNAVGREFGVKQSCVLNKGSLSRKTQETSLYIDVS